MTAPDHVRILVADSHPIVRLGVADSIHTEPDLKVTGEAASGDEVISLLRKHQYDVILLDIAMPGKKTDWIPCTPSARSNRPPPC